MAKGSRILPQPPNLLPAPLSWEGFRSEHCITQCSSVCRVGIWSVMVLCGLSCPAQRRMFALPGPCNIGRAQPSIIAPTKMSHRICRRCRSLLCIKNPKEWWTWRCQGSGQQGKAVRTCRPGGKAGWCGRSSRDRLFCALESLVLRGPGSEPAALETWCFLTQLLSQTRGRP